MTLRQRAACVLLPVQLPTATSRLGDQVGKVRRSTVPKAPVMVIPCYHPGYVLRGGVTREEFKSVVGRFLHCSGTDP